MSDKIIDITKTGPQGFRSLQQQNLQNSWSLSEEDKLALDYLSSQAIPHSTPITQPEYIQAPLEDFGKSRYDLPSYNAEEFERAGDIRAHNQSGLAKLAAGIGKGTVLAGTTFLDGTLGLAYGIGDAVYTGFANPENLEGTVRAKDALSKIWNNDVSNALQRINEEAEKILPNYYSEVENNKSWYQRMGTMNFWADSILKNAGFSVGALLSANASLGILKGMGLVKRAVPARVVGSFLSAFNEGRIEANHNVGQYYDTELLKIENARKQALSSLLQDDPLYASNVALINNSYDKLVKDLQEKCDSMGGQIVLANTIIVGLSDYVTYGRMFSRGMEAARKAEGMGRRTAFRKASEEFLENSGDAAKRGVGGKWEFKKRNGVVKTAADMVIQGNEEMAQAFSAETLKTYYSPDSPDSYYNAMFDPDANIDTYDLLTAAADGFLKTYGNADRYEEALSAAFMSLVGISTFGKRSNMGPETYLGRNKSIGLTGGLIGNIKAAREYNKDAARHVQIMNDYEEKRVSEAQKHITQLQAFTNTLTGLINSDTEGKNVFEYKNAEDNELIAVIQSYAAMGQLKHLKDIVGMEYEAMSDEEMQKTASYLGNVFTSATSDTESPTVVREELTKKRDEINNLIDSYVDSIKLARSISYDSPQISEDQIQELAWLNWKAKRFEQRALTMLKDKKMSEFLKTTNSAIEQAIKDDVFSEDEQGKNLKRSYLALNTFLGFLQEGTKKLPQIQHFLQEAKDVEKALTNEDFVQAFTEVEDQNGFHGYVQMIQDLVKMAKTHKQFTDRFSEYKKNPLAQAKNKESKMSKATQTFNNKRAVKNAKTLVDNPERIDQMEQEDLAASLEKLRGLNIDELEADDAAIVATAIENMADKLEELENEGKLNRIFQSILTEVKRTPDESLGKNSGRIKGMAESLIEAVSKEYDPEILLQDTIYAEDAVYQSYYNHSKPSNDELQELKTLYDDVKNVVQKAAKKVLDTINLTIDEDTIEDPIVAPAVPEVPEGVEDDLDDIPEVPKVPNIEDEEVGNDSVVGTPAINSTKDISAKQVQELNRLLGINLGTQALSSQELLDKLQTTSHYSKEDAESIIKQVKHEGPLQINPALVSSPEEQAPKQKMGGWWNGQPQYIIGNGVISEDTNEMTSFPSDPLVAKLYPIFKEKGVWDYINSGSIKENDKIYFVIDPEVNSRVGETVILLATESGQIVGNLTTPDAESTALARTIREDYAEWSKSNNGLYKFKHNTVVSNWLIGSALISKYRTRQSLSNVVKNPELVIGVENELKYDSSIKKGGQQTALFTPTNVVKNGQVCVLISTGFGTKSNKSKKAVPVSVATVDQISPTMLAYTESILQDALSTNDVIKIKDTLTSLYSGCSFFVIENYIELIYKNGSSKLNIPRDYTAKEIIETIIQNSKQSIYFNVDFNNINKEVIVNGEKIPYNNIIATVLKTDIVLDHTINNGFVIKRMRADGSLIKESTGKMGARATAVPTATLKPATEGTKTVVTTGNTEQQKLAKKDIDDFVNQLEESFKKKRKQLPKENKDRLLQYLQEKTKQHLTAVENYKKSQGEQAFKMLFKNSNSDEVIAQNLGIQAFRKKDSNIKYKPINIAKEIRWLKKVLPQFTYSEHIVLVDSISEIAQSEDADNAWGLFKDGIIYLTRFANKGTLYHEAFHAVTHTILTQKELDDLHNAYKEKYGEKSLVALEEMAAEDFRAYIQLEQMPIIGKVVKAFRKIKHFVNNLVGKESTLDSLFYNISRGTYANTGTQQRNIMSQQSFNAIKQYYETKTSFDNIPEEARQYLDENNISKEEFDNLTQEIREKIVLCLF